MLNIIGSEEHSLILSAIHWHPCRFLVENDAPKLMP
ncbi:uncharacterized protein J3R85_001418 [Psidium guajava]|nr:uncharacterized protein J3R85_001418 [Psidium guajava]